jgi:hypothetical protein
MHVVDLLSATERDSIATRMLRERLELLSLSEIAPRRWIDGSKPPARKLFEFQLLKGASLKACWGFSLDFVPHVSGNIRWHRSDKTARLDVIIDPVALPQPCFLYGPEQFRIELETLLPDAVAGAKRDWSRGSTYDGMLDLIREVREKNTNCFGATGRQLNFFCPECGAGKPRCGGGWITVSRCQIDCCGTLFLDDAPDFEYGSRLQPGSTQLEKSP